jgi:hypothetical protein
MTAKHAEIKKQIEYYLGDENLAIDEFFRDKISQSKDGWILVDTFLACNKVKKMNLKSQDIIEACKSSTDLEINEDKK